MAGVEGKVAFLTGAASGIGRATAQILAQAGADVVVADINQAGAEETAQSVVDYGRKALALPVDDWTDTEPEWGLIHEMVLICDARERQPSSLGRHRAWARQACDSLRKKAQSMR